jgi:hypothetical protein
LTKEVAMDILYTSDQIPDYVKGGIIMFTLKDRVMSRVKSKVWKTLSHAGILYQSSVSGSPTTWIIYMDEIYGIISVPLHIFLRNSSLPKTKGWAIRYIPNFDNSVSRALNNAISKHSSEDSHLGLDEDNHITGSFDDELKSILGIPLEPSSTHKEYNTNLGFVMDILKDFWDEMQVGAGEKTSSITFADDEIAQHDLMQSFYQTHDLMKSVQHILNMVNLSTYTITPPIQPLLTGPLPLFEPRLIVPTDDFYQQEIYLSPPPTILPNITEERQHVAEVISRIFESGLGSDSVREYFEEELETTSLARRGRNELTVEYTQDLFQALVSQLELMKKIIDVHGLPTKLEKETYNAQLQELIVAQGSLVTHLGITDVRIPIDKLKLK